MVAEPYFLHRLQRVRKTRLGWTACCPVHDDRHPSLAIIASRHGWMLTCHAGCPWQEVCKALDIDYMRRGKFFDYQQQATARREPMRPKIVETYDYVDAAGNLLFQVVRYVPKDFRQRRPVQGGWAWSLAAGRYRREHQDSWRRLEDDEAVESADVELPEVPRVLFCLDRLAQCWDDPTIVVCEGEKDVLNLWAIGIAATTNPGGAGKFTMEMARCLTGRRVVLVPDADEKGQLHMAGIVTMLQAWGVRSTRTLMSLPGGAKDISDWLLTAFAPDADAAVKRAAFWELAAQAPEYRRL